MCGLIPARRSHRASPGPRGARLEVRSASSTSSGRESVCTAPLLPLIRTSRPIEKASRRQLALAVRVALALSHRRLPSASQTLFSNVQTCAEAFLYRHHLHMIYLPLHLCGPRPLVVCSLRLRVWILVAFRARLFLGRRRRCRCRSDLCGSPFA